MAKQQACGQPKHRSHKKRWQRYEKPQPGLRVQVDVKLLERLPSTSKRLYQFTALDDCTRIRVLKVFDACDPSRAVALLAPRNASCRIGGGSR